MLKRVISGGQTGVDRAGLDAAMSAGIPVGGYCPKGRLAEDGIIPYIYPLDELTTSTYMVRTETNVIVSDGTLILNKGPVSDGTKYTYEYATRLLKPCLIVHFDSEQTIGPVQVIRWIQGQYINTLNIAGPRESKFPDGIYREAFSYLEKVFEELIIQQGIN